MCGSGLVSRRSVLKGAVSSIAVAGGGVTLLAAESEPAVAATGLSAADVNVSTNDGSLNTLTLEPDVDVSWDGQETKVSEVQYTWSASTSFNSGTLGTFSKSVTTPGKNGSVFKSFSRINMLGRNSGPLTASNFESSTDGGSNSTDVTITLDVTLKDEGGSTITTKNDILSATYSVTVSNKTSTVSSSGTANTGGS